MTRNVDHSKLIAFLEDFSTADYAFQYCRLRISVLPTTHSNALGKDLFEKLSITYKEDEDVLLVYSTCEVISALIILLHSSTADYAFYSMYGDEGPYLKCYNLPKF